MKVQFKFQDKTKVRISFDLRFIFQSKNIFTIKKYNLFSDYFTMYATDVCDSINCKVKV